MVGKRTLPERRNALLDPEQSPSHEILADRRRLGQTNLAVKPGVTGLSKTSKAENLGTFDYAHLRVPLPKDLSGSGIFTLKNSTSYPESYFLMRRSSDGFISATGMFKAAFPWASLLEEEAERRFQKTFPSAGPDEVAGSVWIAPDEALRLSEEYGMRHWIVALLDPSPIEPGTKDKDKKHIQMPPRFDVDKAVPPPVVLPPTSSLRATRARSSRSASPSKMPTTPRKIASPRKSRATRSSVKPEAMNGTEIKEVTKATSTEEVEVSGDAVELTQESTIEQTQEIVQNGTAATDSVASSLQEEQKEQRNLQIEIAETVEEHGDVETTTTSVKIIVPHDHPELPEPEDPTKMIEEAKRMVEEARAVDEKSGAASSSKSKRKVAEVDEDEEVIERSAKRTQYTTEQKLKKEKMTTRALFGIGVMAAIGTAFSYLA